MGKDSEARNFLIKKFLPTVLDTFDMADKLYQQLCNVEAFPEDGVDLQVLSMWKDQEKKLSKEIMEVFMRFEYYNSPFDIEPFKSKMQSDSYACEFYSALCNNDFEHESGEKFCCSWRYAGGVVAQIRQQDEDYLDFYCKGAEGHVTDEIRNDLNKAGWKVVTESDTEI